MADYPTVDSMSIDDGAQIGKRFAARVRSNKIVPRTIPLNTSVSNL